MGRRWLVAQDRWGSGGWPEGARGRWGSGGCPEVRRPATRRRSRTARSMRRRGPPPAASAGQETITPPRPATSASPSTISASATSPGSRIADASQETGSAGSSTLIHQCESCCDRRGVPAWRALCCDDQAGAQRRSGWAAGRGPSKDVGDQTGAEEEEVGPAAGDGDEQLDNREGPGGEGRRSRRGLLLATGRAAGRQGGAWRRFLLVEGGGGGGGGACCWPGRAAGGGGGPCCWPGRAARGGERWPAGRQQSDFKLGRRGGRG